MGPTPVYGARAEKPPKNADFAMKQTNICRLSGDINYGLGLFVCLCIVAFRGISMTRKLCYRKDDRAMRPIGPTWVP